MATVGREHGLLREVGVQVHQFKVRGGALDITLVHDHFENFIPQNLLDLLLDTELTDATTLLLAVLALNFFFARCSLCIANFLLVVVDTLGVVLLLLTNSGLNQLMGILCNLIVLRHEHVDLSEQPGHYALLQLCLKFVLK